MTNDKFQMTNAESGFTPLKFFKYFIGEKRDNQKTLTGFASLEFFKYFIGEKQNNQKTLTGFTPLKFFKYFIGEKRDNQKTLTGFTLIEMVIYVALVAIIVSIIVTFGFWMIQVGAKTKVNSEVLANARRAMETMTYEIKRSKSVYTPTSVFETNPGQLSLEQVPAAGVDETTNFIDFFLCGQALCLKREKAGPIALTNDSVRVTNLSFQQRLNSLGAVSVQIDLKVESLASSRPEYTASIELIETANLRSY